MTQQLYDRAAQGLAIDPRIRQRRVAVQREEGRRRLCFVVLAAAVAIAVAAVVGATQSPLLDVDRVEVRGASRTPHPDLVAASGLDGHPRMVEVDTAQVARRIEALPWVDHAQARRAWPGAVVIEVSERRPVAVARAGAGWAVVDGTGRVLEVVTNRPAKIPALAGAHAPAAPGTSLAAAAETVRVAGALPPGLHERVSEIQTTPGNELVLQLTSPGGEVRLGGPDALEAKLISALTVLQKADVTRLRTLDVRAPAAPVLTRR
ncbi:MAG: FtsQ-type POTRA domain-containing protein [Actinomycetota bacterium]|nr:FtsQ-type POTRA domain-containing protein [Actinomycetota bacterium]